MIIYRGYTLKTNNITGLPDIYDYSGEELISAGYETWDDAQSTIDNWVEGSVR
jgi:hypothetical protein